MLPQMAFTYSLVAFVALLQCFSFYVNPQPENYPTAIAPLSWTNSPSFQLAFTFNDSQTIRSILFRLNIYQGVSFAIGFYCFPPFKSFSLSISTYKSFSLSIYIIHTYKDHNGDYWYDYSDCPRVIWLANRARPVSENATLQLTSKDGLTLRDSDGSLVWSTGGLNQSVAGINITEVDNLVLFDIKNDIIWQSFDHPTNCLVVHSPHSSSKVGPGAIVGSAFGALLFMLTFISIFIVYLRRPGEAQDEEIMTQLPGRPTKFTFEELQVATKNFVKILGKGGFGTVFEGRWGDGRIAVKRLDNIRHGKKDFLAEVDTIGNINHINLVKLIGFCADKLNRLLVYGYMFNGSLDQWIYCRDGRVPLDWPTRFKIITHIAKGLCYLHEDCMQKIVHFDIKPANIILDENFNAKVFDFGLSKLIDRDISRVMTKMRGTPGYLAPEWMTSMVTEKVDVYSFGIVVMKILSGRRNIDFFQTEENHHLIKLLEEKSTSNTLSDLIDKKLGVELYKNEIVNVMKLAMWCLQWDSTQWPSMLIVVKVLEGAMEVETSLDYNFVSSIPMIVNIPSVVDQSAPFPASVLSSPR